MDHSFSIDTCLYNNDSINPLDHTYPSEPPSKHESDSSLKKKIEEELGLAPSEEAASDADEASKPTLLKRCIDNLAKIKLADKVSFLRDYFGTKSQFEYSVNTIDSYTLEEPKSLDTFHLSQVSTAPFATNDFSTTDEELSKLNSISEQSKFTSIEAPGASYERAGPESGLDSATLARAFLKFVENTDTLARRAVEDNHHLFADKLLCNVFRKLKEVYDRDFENHYPNLVDEQGQHPLYNLNFNLPSRTPDLVRAKLEEMSRDPVYQHNLAERIFIFHLLDKFKMFDLTDLCLSYQQPLIDELWSLTLDSLLSKNNRDLEDLYNYRNSLFRSNSKDYTVDYKNMPSIEIGSNSQTSPPEADGDHFAENDPNSSPLDSDRLSSGSYSFEDPSLSKDDSEQGSGRENWVEDVYMPNSEVLDYILKTNRTLDPDRISGLKKHFNLTKNYDRDGWAPEPNTRLQTYHLVGKNSVSIKVRGKLPCDIMTALTIITETELAPEWIPFLRDSKDLKLFSKTSRIFKQAFEYPMIGLKESLVYGLSTNMLDEANCVILSCSNPPSNRKDAEAVIRVLKGGGLENTDFITLDAKNNCTILGYTVDKMHRKSQKSGDICFLLFPYKDGETIMEVYGSVVPEVKIVPMKFVTYLAKKIITGMFKKVAQISKNFNESKFADTIRERSDFYGWMDTIYQEYKLNNPQSFMSDPARSIYTYNSALRSGRVS